MVLPIEVIDIVSGRLLGVARVALLVGAACCAVVGLAWSGGGAIAVSDAMRAIPRSAKATVCLLAAMTVTIAAFAAGRVGLEAPGRFLVAQMGIVACLLVMAAAGREHRPLLVGYLVGVTASAFTSVLQTVGAPSIREVDGLARFPGLAAATPQLSWQVALAIMVGVYLAVTERGIRRGAAVAALLPCTLALVACGAQGGIIGLVAATVVLAIHGARQGSVSAREVARFGVGSIAAVVVAVTVLAVAGASPTSLVGLSGDPDKGFENESARVDGFTDGIRALLDEPLTGPGVERYREEYRVVPHVAPLNLAVSTGVVGLAIGSAAMAVLGFLVVRGPRRGAALSWLGVGMLSVFLVKCMVTPGGPFAGVHDRLLLVIAVVAASSPGGTVVDGRAGPGGERRAGEASASPSGHAMSEGPRGRRLVHR